MSKQQERLLPCPFCGGDARADSHADDCYFTLHRALNKAPDGDASLHLEVLEAWNRRAALEAGRAAVPAGWVLVPAQPTPKMVDATWDDPVDREFVIESQNKRNKRIYAAMLAASPQPVAQPSECWCETCDLAQGNPLGRTRMSTCPECGDKRCPRAKHHDAPCQAAQAKPEQAARQLTTRELADVTAPWSNIWSDKSFGIANAAIAKFCEVNGITASPKE